MKDHPEKHEISQLVPQYWLRIKNKGGRSNETKKNAFIIPLLKKNFVGVFNALMKIKGGNPQKKRTKNNILRNE